MPSSKYAHDEDKNRMFQPLIKKFLPLLRMESTHDELRTIEKLIDDKLFSNY